MFKMFSKIKFWVTRWFSFGATTDTNQHMSKLREELNHMKALAMSHKAVAKKAWEAYGREAAHSHKLLQAIMEPPRFSSMKTMRCPHGKVPRRMIRGLGCRQCFGLMGLINVYGDCPKCSHCQKACIDHAGPVPTPNKLAWWMLKKGINNDNIQKQCVGGSGCGNGRTKSGQ